MKCLSIFCFFLIIFGFLQIPAFGSSTEGKTLKDKLLETAGDVLLEAAKFGLDEAGNRILGPTAWNGFKRIASPVFNRLQELFPMLSFNSPDNSDSQIAAEKAVNYLNNNQDLQNLLLSNFLQLKEGQTEILSGIDRVEQLARKTSADTDEIKKVVHEIRHEMKVANSQFQNNELHTWIDVSDIVEHYFILTRINARRQGSDVNIRQQSIVFWAIGMHFFVQRVLEEGKAHKIYKSKILGYEATANALGKYPDNSGRLCRKVTTDTQQWGMPERHTMNTSIYCKHEGKWDEVRHLERRDY